MLSPEILAIRRTGIAATDAAPIVRLSPWKTPADVWLDKKHPIPVEQKEAKWLKWGTRLEDDIADEYSEQTGLLLNRAPLTRNEHVPWLMAQPDRLVLGRKRGLECKTAGDMHRWEWGPSGTDLVPAHYLIQCCHSMIVTCYDEWDLAVLIGGSDFRIYHLHRDTELLRRLFAQEEEFYRRFIAGDETPEFDWGEGLAAYVEKNYPQSKPKGSADSVLDVDKHGSEELKAALKELLSAREVQGKAEETEALQKTLIQAYMRDCDSLRFEELNKLLITWRNIRSSIKVDWYAIFEEMAPHISLNAEQKKAIVDKHTEEKPGGRRFVVYDKKQKKKDEKENDA